MKAILVIDLPNDLDISLDEIKADITVSSKDVRKSMLYLQYKNIVLKPLPQKKKNKDIIIKGKISEILEARYEGWNESIDEILGE